MKRAHFFYYFSEELNYYSEKEKILRMFENF